MTRARTAVLAGAVAFLTVAGAGIAYAATTSPLDLDVSAAGAHTGITVPSETVTTGLGAGYDEAAGVFANAGALTVTNTGDREATYRLTIQPSSSTATLPAAIQVAVGTVATTGACTTTVALTNAQTGALGSGDTAQDFLYTSETVPTKLAPGESIVLCVKTSIEASAIGGFGATSIDLSLTADLRYATGAAWTATADPIQVTQHIETQDIANLFNGAGRFYFFSAYDANAFGSSSNNIVTVGGYCMAWGASPPRFGLSSNTGCGGWNDQVRLVAAPGSPDEFMLLQNVNGWDQPSTPRWETAGSNKDVFLGAPIPAATNQRWVIEGRGDGTYRIIDAASVGTAAPQCLQYTTLDINPNSEGGGSASSGMKQVRPTTCIANTAASHDTADYRRQGFRFDLIGTPLPPKDLYPDGYPATCGNVNSDNTYLRLSWPVSDGYENETRFRILWAYRGVDGNGQPFTTPAQTVLTHDNGGATHTGLYNYTAGLETFWTWLQDYLSANGLPASGDSATVEMTIEQQITNNDIFRRITAPLEMGVRHLATGDNRVYCGAPPAPPTPTPTPTPTPSPTPTAPAGPISFPASWCTPQGQGYYLQLSWPYADGNNWRVFLWKSGDPAINPATDTGRIAFTNTWYEDGQPHVQLNFDQVTTWLTQHGVKPNNGNGNSKNTLSGVEVRIYRDLGGGNWEYYAMRPMTFKIQDGTTVTCA